MKRKKKTELKHNTVTTIYLVFVLVALVVLVVSFFDIPFMEKTNEILTELDFSTQLQIINTIMCCTISILGIAFTVQDRKRFGVRITTYYGMRRNGFFNFKKNIKVSISLMAIGMFALAANKNVPLLLISIYIILLCIASLKIEIPFLEADEKTLVNCLRRELIKELSSETDLDSFNSININYAIAGLLIEKNLDETYKNLCTDDTEKNKELLLKLLDIQSENKYFVESFNSKSETIKAAESISNSIQSILGGGFDLVGVVGEDLNKFLFPILKLIYRGLENTESQDKIKHIISEYSMQMFETKNEELDTLKFNVVTYVIINEIKSNKLDIIKEYRKNLSTNLFFYKNNHYTTRVFMMISFVIYYLTEIEKDFDEEIKENILQFINDSGRERDFKIESWKTIFKKFTESMNYSIDDFLDDFNTNKNRYEYWYYDNNAKC